MEKKLLPGEIFVENYSKSDFKVILKWFQMGFKNGAKLLPRRFSWKIIPRSDFQSDFKVILKGFQSDFSCKKWSKTASSGDFHLKLLQKWFQSDFKVISNGVSKMEQNCFQGDFPGKLFQKVILKVISKWFWKGFQSDFSCKNGAKLLPVEIFLENYSKKWFQSDL